VDTDDITGLLPSIWYSHSFYYNHWITFDSPGSRWDSNSLAAFVKLNPKSISVLLEDEGGKTSSEGHNQTILQLIKVTV